MTLRWRMVAPPIFAVAFLMERLPPVIVKFPWIIMAPAARDWFQSKPMFWPHSMTNCQHVDMGVISSNMFQMSEGTSLRLTEMEDPPGATLRVKMDFHRFSSSLQETFHHLMFCSQHLNKNIAFEILANMKRLLKSLLLTPRLVFTCSSAHTALYQNHDQVDLCAWKLKWKTSYVSKDPSNRRKFRSLTSDNMDNWKAE